MKRTWTDEQLALVREFYPTKNAQELCELIPGKTAVAIKEKAKLLGVRKARSRHKFTPEEIDLVRMLFPNTLSQDIADRIGVPIYSIYGLAYRLGLQKAPGFMAELSRERMTADHPARRHQFKKGQVSHNKGKIWDEIMPKESQERSRSTCFKKGDIPANAYDDGEVIVRQRPDRGDPPYKWIKVPGNRKLVSLHRHVWEQANGPIPKDHNIVFKDGDTLNCELSNLEVISNHELMLRNTIHRYPEDVRRLMQAKGALTRKINEQLKHNKSWQTQE